MFSILAKPVAEVSEETVKATVVEHNVQILRGLSFPGTVFKPNELLGDPNYMLRERGCVVLTEIGALVRTPVMDNGRQMRLQEGSLLWDYAWNPEVTDWVSLLSEQQLADLAWDLRYHRNFAHVSLVGEPPTSSEDSLDSEESEEYDDNLETEESE